MTFNFVNKIFTNNGKEYQISFLEDIDVSNMATIKERKHKQSDTLNHYRIIHYDQSSKTFYKIWEKDYAHNKSFTRAMAINAYDNHLILPLKALIFDREHICRGYVTFEGEHTDKELSELPELYDSCKRGIMATKWASCDIVTQNIIKYNNNYCLIDYDDIYPLENFVGKDNSLFYSLNGDLYLIKPSYYNDYLFNTYFVG